MYSRVKITHTAGQLKLSQVACYICCKRKCDSHFLFYTSCNCCVLLSQGHRRKNWKVRKFMLRDDPAFMHYYDPTKVKRQSAVTLPHIQCLNLEMRKHVYLLPFFLCVRAMTLWAPSISVALWLQQWSLSLMVSDNHRLVTILPRDTCRPSASPLRPSNINSVYCQCVSVPLLSLFNTLSCLFSQKTRSWRQPLRDHHIGWGPLLPPSCHQRGEEGVDQGDTGGVKERQITGAAVRRSHGETYWL